VVVVDEAHHATAGSYRGVLEEVGLGEFLSSSASEGGSDDGERPREEGQSPNSSSSISSSSGSPSSNTSSSSSLKVGYDPDATSLSSSSSDEEEAAASGSADLTSDPDLSPDADLGKDPSSSDAAMGIWLAQGKLLLGFTATPYRMSGRQTKELEGMMAPTYHRDIAYMVKEGYLAKVGDG
jgi:hypothetical protein